VVAVTALLIPCATAAQPTFVSHLYHYSLQVPQGFRVQAATIPLLPGFYPSGNGASDDEFHHGKTTIAIAATPLASHESLKAWVKSRVALLANEVSCVRHTSHPAIVAGVPAVELVYGEGDCYGYFDAIETVHNGRGYDLFWQGPPETFTLRHDLSSFRFTT
jgi:hypothetical protein